jgi:N-acetylglucosamine kinase-like BadF-type ATPase
VGAARGLLQRKTGLVCILDSGSNSGYYDGANVVKSVRGLGFILGNEGSKSHIGRLFVSDLLKGLTPNHIAQAFYNKFKVSDNDIMDNVYEGREPSKALSTYAEFLSDFQLEAYVHDLVYGSIMSFFKRNIVAYHYADNPVHFVGSTCLMYRKILEEVAKDFGVEIGRIEPYTMEGLMQYHSR